MSLAEYSTGLTRIHNGIKIYGYKYGTRAFQESMEETPHYWSMRTPYWSRNPPYGSVDYSVDVTTALVDLADWHFETTSLDD